MSDDLSAAKQAMRKAMAAQRARLDAPARRQAAEILARRLPGELRLTANAIVAGYHPVRTEFDVLPLLRVLAALGLAVALPVVDGPDRPLLFRRHVEGARLGANRFGIPEPGPDAPILTPSHLLVPLLAFDADGYRLGYGGGYYDRTLAWLRSRGRTVTAIGVGFECQRVEAVPHGADDQPLDFVATERGLHGPRGSPG